MASRSLRVLHVIPSLSLQTGGPSVVVTDLASALQESGIQTRIITTDALTPAQAQPALAGARLEDFPDSAKTLDVGIFPLAHPYRLSYSPRLGHALNAEVPAFDLIHIHSINLYPQYAAWRMASKYGRPFVVTPHGALDPWIRGKRKLLKQANDVLWQRRMLNQASAIHTTAADERRLIQPINIRAHMEVIPNGISVRKFSGKGVGLAFRQRWLAGYTGPLVLNHGRLSEKKGLDVLVAALSTLPQDLEARLVLVGADDEGQGDMLRKRAADLGINDSLTILPPLSGQDLHDAIASADIWVLPSHSENFGLAVAEAMAAGKPIITSPHVNLAPDAAAAGALMMVPNTVDEVAAGIITLLADSNRRISLGRAAAKYVEQFDWSNVAPAFIDFYERVIDGHAEKVRN